MPSKSQRPTTRKVANVSAPSTASSGTEIGSQEGFPDLSTLSSVDIFKKVMELNKDPLVHHYLTTLAERIPREFSEALEGEKRGRSVVISGLEEARADLPPSARQKDLEGKVARVLDALDVECAPTEVYRMGRPDPARPRLVKIVFPSTAHFRRALANARLLRHAGFPDVFIRKSMTAEERKRDYELRKQASERNRGKGTREWVVYRGELTHVSNLPRRGSGNQ
ncbi:unnamed protein product [Nippostrongylus brasiliensis]|uniref:Uncharacterized protein n=1 Tax=Nippostrongylus brasiliensis TaxID=27835 RepID=A0A0N4XCN0_NIPBR|nr:unnamed protein product [Nippostrongylus brasiliensis]